MAKNTTSWTKGSKNTTDFTQTTKTTTGFTDSTKTTTNFSLNQTYDDSQILYDSSTRVYDSSSVRWDGVDSTLSPIINKKTTSFTKTTKNTTSWTI